MSLRRLTASADTAAAMGDTAPVRASRRRSRAKPRPPRARAVIMAELKGLGGLVHEQALLDATAQPQASLVEWTNRLAAELGVATIGAPASYRELLWAIVEVSRGARADDAAQADAPEVA